MSEPAVRVEAVRKTYRSGDRPVPALGPVSFEIEAGTSVAVVGPSGCGKSTLLRIVAGLDGPSAGRVLIDGSPVAGAVAGIGVVFQRDLLLDWRNVVGNVVLPAELQGRPLGPATTRARELLDELDIGDFAEQQPWELSGGMRQRVAIARALLCEPRMLLLDEPFSALDAMTRDQMGVLLQRVQQRAAATTMLITHSIPEAVFLSDRVLVVSARPGVLLDDVAVDLPRPRSLGLREEPEFAAIARRIREQFERVGVLAG